MFGPLGKNTLVLIVVFVLALFKDSLLVPLLTIKSGLVMIQNGVNSWIIPCKTNQWKFCHYHIVSGYDYFFDLSHINP